MSTKILIPDVVELDHKPEPHAGPIEQQIEFTGNTAKQEMLSSLSKPLVQPCPLLISSLLDE